MSAAVLPAPAVAPASCPSWYVVHTKVHQEQVACENLLRQGYAVYLPKFKLLKRLRGRQQACLEPLFPRYLFLRPTSNDQSIAPVRSTLGVSALVRFGHQLALMRDEMIEHIRQFEIRRNASSEQEISPFKSGVRITVAEGPLAGLEGLVSDVRQERVVVLLNLLGQETPVNLSHHQLVVAH